MGKEIKAPKLIIKRYIMNTFNIDLKIKATIHGLRYSQQFNQKTKQYEEDRSSFQVQTIIENKKGEDEKHTLKVYKELPPEKLKEMIGSTFLFSEVEEYAHKNSFNVDGNEISFNTYTYSAKDFTKSESVKDIFNVDKSVKIKISKTVDIIDKDGKSTGNTKIQTKVIDGLSIDIKTIKLKEITLSSVSNLLGKEVIVKDLVVTKMNGKSFYSSATKPELIK